MKNEIFTKGLEMALWHYSGAYFLPAGRISSCRFSERNKRIDRQSRSGDSWKRRRLTVELLSGIPNTSPLREGSV